MLLKKSLLYGNGINTDNFLDTKNWHSICFIKYERCWVAFSTDTGGEKLSYNPFYNIENSELLGYEYAWVNYIKNNIIPEGIIPKEILESWSRCRAIGLGALAGSIEPYMISDEELTERTEKNRDFLNAGRHVTQEILSMLSEESVQMWIADKDRVILLDFGKQDTEVDKDVKGTSNAEEHIGTMKYSQ